MIFLNFIYYMKWLKQPELDRRSINHLSFNLFIYLISLFVYSTYVEHSITKNSLHFHNVFSSSAVVNVIYLYVHELD